MQKIKRFLLWSMTPGLQKNWIAEVAIAIPRILCGFLLSFDFGASKFGMPWTPESQHLALFEVAEWFPNDIAAFGGIFAMSPLFFAWIGAASEAIGGLFLTFGFQTRLFSMLIACTMLVAIFFQKWDQGIWGKLPAMGFLWVAIYGVVLGSGKLGIDYLFTKK
jgi:putative oxidoreductase